MRQLTDAGRSALESVAQRNGVSFDAVTTLLAALDRGGGSQAQFSHYELGGMGQWSQGGMIMVGDMFNNGLKYRVDQLCNELSNLMRSQDLFVPTPAYGAMGGSGGWWPAECGQPSSQGSQNDMHYAVFPATRRLALRLGDQIRVYDTGNHQIGGFSQQQGGDAQNLTFNSQYGTVRLYDLPLVSGGMPAQAPSQTAPMMPQPVPSYDMPAQSQVFGNSGQSQSQGFHTSGQSQGFGGQMQSQGGFGMQMQTPSFDAATGFPPVPQVSPAPSPAPAAPEPADVSPIVHEPVHAAPVVPQPGLLNGHAQPAPVSDDDIFAKIERLHVLQTKGILSETEFAAKKKDLLDRL